MRSIDQQLEQRLVELEAELIETLSVALERLLGLGPRLADRRQTFVEPGRLRSAIGWPRSMGLCKPVLARRLCLRAIVL